ncbi:EpsG family protein [Lachnospiraceae bacterium 62-26]
MDFLKYIGVFLSSSFMGLMYDNYYNRKKNGIAFLKFVWIIAIGIVPIYISCVRSGIGADYKVYYQIIDLAQNSNYSTFKFYFSNIEIGNWLLIELANFLFGTVESVFALYSVLTGLFLVSSILYYRNRVSTPVALFVMYVLLYPASLNTMRQILAVSIMLFAFRYIENKNVKGFLVCLFAAMLFHTTAIITAIYFLYWYFFNDKKNVTSKLFNRMIIFMTVSMPLLLILGCMLVKDVPIIGDYFINYSMQFNYEYRMDLFWRIPLYLLFIYEKKYMLEYDEYNKLYFYVLLSDFEFVLMSFVVNWTFRFTYYSAISFVVLCASRVNSEKRINSKILRTNVYMIIFMAIFFFLHILWERDNIVPYLRL